MGQSCDLYITLFKLLFGCLDGGLRKVIVRMAGR